MNETEPTLAQARDWLALPKRPFVAGAWIDPDDGVAPRTLVNPANQEPLATVRECGAATVNRAVAAAREAFEGPWASFTRRERAELLRALGTIARDHRAELATLESLQNGMTWSESFDGNLPDCADIWDYFAGWVDKLGGETLPVEKGYLNYTLRQPLGVCGQIVPWNFPLLLAMWKIAPALATGNTVVLKPSEHTPLSLLRWLELALERVDLPPGVLNVVLGGAAVGEAIGRHPGVAKVSFTGSTRTGRSLVHNSAESNLKLLTLELGGKSPNIIFDDVADVEAAIDRSFGVMFSQKGEKCSEPTRLFVHERHYERVLAGLIARAEATVCGDPFAADTTQGPQCHRAHFESVLRYIDIGREEGATVVAGGGADVRGANANGYFVRPTIFTDVENHMRIAQEEIFGPVLTVQRFRDEDEVVAAANDVTYGLAAGFWTADVSRALRVAERLQAGMIFINRYGCYDLVSPFGGIKQSGWGKDLGRPVLDAYTQQKSVWIAFGA